MRFSSLFCIHLKLVFHIQSSMKIGAAVGDFISVKIKTQNFHAYGEY